MKYPVITAFILMFASCTTPEPEIMTIPTEEVAAATVATANAQTSLFISGMTCEMGCKGAIESKVGKSEGIVDFSITFADSTAVVSFDSALVSPQVIASRIAAVGGGGLYSATLIK